MYKNKNDYSVIVFGSRGYLCKLEYVQNLYSLVKWLENSRKYRGWKMMNVYNRRSGEFIKQYKKGSFIDAKPRFK